MITLAYEQGYVNKTKMCCHLTIESGLFLGDLTFKSGLEGLAMI